MKKLSLFLLIAFTLSSCQEDVSPTDFGSLNSFWIHATLKEHDGSFTVVSGYTRPTHDSVAFIQSEIDSSGRIKLYVPTPPPHLLSSYTPLDTVMVYHGDSSLFIDDVTIHDSSLRYTRLELDVESIDPPAMGFPFNQGHLTTPHERAQVGDYYLSYYYFTSQTVIDGSFEWRVVLPDTSSRILTQYSIHTGVGWNLLMTRYSRDSANTSIYEVTNLRTEQGEWIIALRHSFPNIVLEL
jgi:hypothetical protein